MSVTRIPQFTAAAPCNRWGGRTSAAACSLPILSVQLESRPPPRRDLTRLANFLQMTREVPRSGRIPRGISGLRLGGGCVDEVIE